MEQGHSSTSPFYYQHIPSYDSFSQSGHSSTNDYSVAVPSEKLEAVNRPSSDLSNTFVDNTEELATFDPSEWCSVIFDADTTENTNNIQNAGGEIPNLQPLECDGAAHSYSTAPEPYPGYSADDYLLTGSSQDNDLWNIGESRTSVPLDAPLGHPIINEDYASPLSELSRASVPPLSRGITRSPSTFSTSSLTTPIEPSQPFHGTGVDRESLPPVPWAIREDCFPSALQLNPETAHLTRTPSSDSVPGSPPKHTQSPVPSQSDIGGSHPTAPLHAEFTFRVSSGPAGEVPCLEQLQSGHVPEAHASVIEPDRSSNDQEAPASAMKRPTKKANKKKSSRQNRNVVKALVTADGLSASSLPKDRVRKAMRLRKAFTEYTCVFPDCTEELSEADVAKHVERHLKDLDLASGATCPLGCKRTQKDLPARKRHVLQAHLHAGEQYCGACEGSFSRVSWDQVIRHLETKPTEHAEVWRELGLQWKVVASIGADNEGHVKGDAMKVDAASNNDGVEFEFVEGSSTGKKRRRL